MTSRTAPPLTLREAAPRARVRIAAIAPGRRKHPTRLAVHGDPSRWREELIESLAAMRRRHSGWFTWEDARQFGASFLAFFTAAMVFLG